MIMNEILSAPAVRRRLVTADQLEPGDELHFEGKRRLVARVVPSREDVMVELWSRGDVEHAAHFLAPDQLVVLAVGQ